MIKRHVVYRTLRRVEKRMTVPIVGACLYEAVALTFPSKHVPPVTVLANRHKALFVTVTALVGLHVWFYEVPNV